MEKRDDRRVTMTKRLLKDALIELLRQQSIYQISIRELCQRADVNRTTFYKYYGSQFDLLADMEDDIVAFVNSTVTQHETSPERIIRATCDYLEENLEFARLIINNNIDPAFPQRVFSSEVLRGIVRKNYVRTHDEAEVEYLYNFITYGAFRMVSLWLNKEDREPPEKLARLIIQMAM